MITVVRELLKEREARKLKDFHVLRFFSSWVAVSEGKVVHVTDPVMQYCPLAAALYAKLRKLKADDARAVKQGVKEIVEKKIERFGFFTERRELFNAGISVPYGASEILMYARRKNIIEAAVLVCDGAGSVIVTQPEMIQGIGARMNGLFYTSPLQAVMRTLKEAGAHVVFEDARIDQIGALEEACRLGYKKIGVTVNASMDEEKLERIKELEARYHAVMTTLVVCTTGISQQRVRETGDHGDLIWSCASEAVREMIGPRALIQISESIPVFVLTKKGLDMCCAYSDHGNILKELDERDQYLISQKRPGRKIRMGEREVHLSPACLPVRSSAEPA